MTRITPRLLPGPHVALLSADRRTIVVPGSEDAVGPLWALLADAGDAVPDLFEHLLDVVLAAGLRGRPGFALVRDEPDAVRVAVRGAWAAHLPDHDAPLRAADDVGWREARLPAGARVLLTTADGVGGPGPGWSDAPSGPLVVRLGGLELPGVAPAVVPVVEAPMPVVEAPLPAVAAPAPIIEAPAPVIEAPAPVEPIRPRPALQPDPLTVPLAALLGGLDDEVSDPEPLEPAVPAATPVLRLSAGEVGEIALDRPVVIGRAPRALGPDPDEEVRLVAVPSPHHEISSTHLEIRPGVPDPLVPTVTDLGSTNGTLVIRPGRPPETLRPGIPAAVTPGVVVDLGDGLTIELGVGA